jgi:hypothetical protein
MTVQRLFEGGKTGDTYMTTPLKIAALSLGAAIALVGATSASADGRYDTGRDYHGHHRHMEARFERHHHWRAERRHERFDHADRHGMDRHDDHMGHDGNR